MLWHWAHIIPTTLGHTTKTQESKQPYLMHRKEHRKAAKTRRQKKHGMKEQIKTPEKEISKMKISNLSDAEFKTLVIKMLKELSEVLN